MPNGESGVRRLYTLLFYSALPLVLGRLYVRGNKLPAYRQRWAERLGFYPDEMPALPSPLIWFHAVSVGEVEAVIPLVRATMQHWPSHRLLITTTTPTGSARVRAILGHRVAHVYLPYDLPVSLQRFLGHFSPDMAVIMETEIWPNLLVECQKAKIPVIIANARLSSRSTSRYAHIRAWLKDCLSAVHIAAQTEDDAERFASLGIASERISVTGNLKFDLEVPETLHAEGKRLGQFYFQDRQVLLLASSHAGEEAALLDIYARLKERHPFLCLMIAPRHPERFNEVYELCATKGWQVRRRSDSETLVNAECPADILVLDTLGELRTFYAASTLAFIGGSLVPIGGHNVLEAAALGVPSLYGQHTQNFRQICEQLETLGGAVRVNDQQALFEKLDELLLNADQRGHMAHVAREFVAHNRGALGKHLALMARWLPSQTQDGASSSF